MAKKILIACCLLLCVNQLSAQFGIVKFGVRAGIVYNSLELTAVPPITPNFNISTDPMLGYNFGVMARMGILGFHIQPELQYAMNRFRLTNISSTALTSNSSATVTNGIFSAPILVGYKFLFLRLQAGPVFNFASTSSVGSSSFDSERSSAGNPPKFDVKYDHTSVGYVVGAGIDLALLSFSVRYSGDWSKQPVQTIKIGDRTGIYNNKTTSWTISLGVLF